MVHLDEKLTTNWFLVRGLVRESGHWGDFLENLKKTFPNDNIYCLDIPGNGKYYQKLSPASIEKIVDFMRQDYLSLLNQQKKQNTKNYVLSISFGSMITLDWLQRYPNDFQTAIWINTSFRGLNPFYQRLRPSSYLRILRTLFSFSIATREKNIVRMVSNHKEKWETTTRAWTAIQYNHPVCKLNAIRQLWAAAHYHTPQTPQLPPTLVINSLGDRLVNPYCSEKIHKAWDTDIRTHPTGGHDLIHDEGNWVLQEIKTWLSLN